MKLKTRQIQLRADTLDEKARTVTAVIATENPVAMWGAMEVLRMDGLQMPKGNPEAAWHAVCNNAHHGKYLQVRIAPSVGRIRHPLI